MPSSKVRAVEHDYGTKDRKPISVEDVVISDVGDRVFWVDIPDLDGAGAVAGLGLSRAAVRSLDEDSEVMTSFPGDVFRFDIAYVPFSEWSRTNRFDVVRIRCLLGSRFLVTVHDGRSQVIESLIDGYVTDFRSASKAAVFLVYEMFHHVINSYMRIHHVLQMRLKSVDEKVTTADETIVETAAKLHTEFLILREIAHSSRTVLNHLASRASLFISVNTRPYLDNMSMTLERLDDDLSVDRQIIADSINFYVSVVSYKMNTSIKAMTAVNVIFVPLTLLSAIYGMNFLSMPEYKWRYGYLFFWAIFFTTAMVSIIWLKKRG